MTSKTERVVVRFSSGAEYGLRDAETAKRVYPNAEIVRYADGRPYPDAAPESEETDPAQTAQTETGPDLDAMNREQLDEFAPSVGVEPAGFSRKPDLLKAVKAAQAAREAAT